jgi:hypothetical protein
MSCEYRATGEYVCGQECVGVRKSKANPIKELYSQLISSKDKVSEELPLYLHDNVKQTSSTQIFFRP